MKFITLAQFLHLFETDNPHLKTFANFLKFAKVRSGKNLIPLLEYIQDKNIQTTDLKALYDNIVHKNEYLTRFYNTSLDVGELPLHITEKPMKIDAISNNQTIKYKNVIRNMYYKEILQTTKSGIENVPSFLEVLGDLYVRAIIDYKILTPSAIHNMHAGRIGGLVFAPFYFRASIMNPYVPFSLNHGVLKGERIFTPTLGWSSYCYGFLECPHVKEYVGTDVIPKVCMKTLEFAKTYYPEKTTTIFCEPSENLMNHARFRTKYKGYFDVVFFSPPYYRLEMYAGKNQSTEKYKTYSAWLENYWRKTVELSFFVLRPGGKMCYILSGYGSKNTKGSFDLLGDMNKIARGVFAGHRPRSVDMHNNNVNITAHKPADEKIMIFQKE